VHIDFGTGDGTYAYRFARQYSDTLVIGVDSNAENLREISHKAGQKESKGGLSNLLLGQLSLEQSPGELVGFADSISILLPWGSLLRAVALPEPESLLKLRGLLKQNGNSEMTIIFGYSESADPGMVQTLGLPVLDDNFLKNQLIPAYHSAGLRVKANQIPVDEINQIPSRWAKKLAFSGKSRTFVKVTAR